MIMKLGLQQYVLKLYHDLINDDPDLTLTHFKTMSKFAKLVLYLQQLHISGQRLHDQWFFVFKLSLDSTKIE